MAASSVESEERGSAKKTKLTRLGSFSSEEVFHAWAADSLLKPKTIETLIGIHQVDSLPAVLALRNRDIANLGLPIGQARLFQEAVIKLHAEYKYEEPYSPAIKVDVEIPSYKSLLDDTRSPVDRLTGKGNYFRFNNLEASEMGSEPEETFCDGESDKTLLQGNEDDEDERRSGCACQRWLFIGIFMPVILVLSLLGFIVWVILWPIHNYCPCGRVFSRMFKGAEILLLLPVMSVNWAIGRKRERERGPEEISESTETNKRNYGGTEDVSMHELDKTNR